MVEHHRAWQARSSRSAACSMSSRVIAVVLDVPAEFGGERSEPRMSIRGRWSHSWPAGAPNMPEPAHTERGELLGLAHRRGRPARDDPAQPLVVLRSTQRR
jgi:hypothetical protein